MAWLYSRPWAPQLPPGPQASTAPHPQPESRHYPWTLILTATPIASCLVPATPRSGAPSAGPDAAPGPGFLPWENRPDPGMTTLTCPLRPYLLSSYRYGGFNPPATPSGSCLHLETGSEEVSGRDHESLFLPGLTSLLVGLQHPVRVPDWWNEHLLCARHVSQHSEQDRCMSLTHEAGQTGQRAHGGS